MLIERDFLNKLKDFGLNSYEAKLWTALLSRGISTAGELSDIANVPRSRSYDVLESLEKKGFIIMKLGKPIKYIAVQPSEVLERVKKRIQTEADSRVDSLDKLNKSSVIDELNKLHKGGINLVEPSEITGALRGRQNLYNHLQTMIKDAKKSVSIITTSQGLVRKASILKRALKKAKENGAKITIAAPMTKETKANAAKELEGIANLKHTNNTNLRMCIVDGKQAVLMLHDDKIHPSSDFGIWTTAEFFAKGLETLFEKV